MYAAIITDPNCPPALIHDNKLIVPPNTCQFISSPNGSGKLRVRLISASNLMKADIGGTSDPYIKVKATSIDSIKVTRVIDKNLNPIWNEECTLDLATVQKEVLIFDIYDHDKVGNDDLLGFVGVDLALLPMGIEVLTNENLSFAKHGTVQLGITALDFGLTNLPQNYMQAYTTWRNGLQAYERKEFKKLKKGKVEGPYLNKKVHEDYKLVKGYLKRKKNKREKTANGILKGLKKAGSLAKDGIEISVGDD